MIKWPGLQLRLVLFHVNLPKKYFSNFPTGSFPEKPSQLFLSELGPHSDKMESFCPHVSFKYSTMLKGTWENQAQMNGVAE